MGKRCCTQASLPSKHQALLTRGAKEKGGNSRQGWLQLQHIPQYTPLSTTTLSDCSPCQLSTGKAAGKESLLSCWKQKWKFTLSQANFSKSFWETESGEKRWWTADTGQHRICKPLFYVCLFLHAHKQLQPVTELKHVATGACIGYDCWSSRQHKCAGTAQKDAERLYSTELQLQGWKAESSLLHSNFRGWKYLKNTWLTHSHLFEVSKCPFWSFTSRNTRAFLGYGAEGGVQPDNMRRT